MKVSRGIRRLAVRPVRDQAGEAVRIPARGDRAFTAITMAVVAFVAAIAASPSYQHQYELAIRHGQAHWGAAMLPFSCRRHDRVGDPGALVRGPGGHPRPWGAWLVLMGGVIRVGEPSVRDSFESRTS